MFGGFLKGVLFLVIIISLSSFALADGCCFLNYTDVCYEGDEAECIGEEGEFFTDMSCSDVEKCTFECCCEAIPSYDPYPIRKGTCEEIFHGQSLPLSEQECLNTCDLAGGGIPLCAPDCEENTIDCVGKERIVDISVEGNHYCWENDNSYHDQSGCSSNCYSPACSGTDTSCGIYPNCLDCSANDGCYGDYYRNYYCSGTSCSYSSDNCNDCSCSCGGYNTQETNGNCNDGKDNDCDGKTDSEDPGCQQLECTSGPCCDLSIHKVKPNGAQPTGYTDDTDGFCSGGNVRTSNYYCNGIDADQHYTYTTVDICGICEYCTDDDLTCNPLPSSSTCGTLLCDYSDTTCRDYHDIVKYCTGTGICNTYSCDSYTDAPAGTSCGTDKECDGNGNCIEPPDCNNGIKDGDEVGIDCRGSCPNQDCCTNKYQDENLGEEGVDCGPYCHYSCIVPIMLVHGYLSDPETDWSSVKTWLEEDNYTVGLVDLTLQKTGGFATGDIKEYAKWLRAKIRDEKTTNRAKNVDIIGYDMGGLVARWYVNSLNGTDVRNIYLIGTPNHGTEIFWGDEAVYLLLDILGLKTKLADVAKDIIKYIRGEASEQMSPNSPFLNELNYLNPKKEDGIDYLAPINDYMNIAGDKSVIAYNYMGQEVQNNFLEKPHDNFVTVASVRLDNLDLSIYHLNHSELTKSLDVYNQIKGILESLGTMSVQRLTTMQATASEIEFHRGPLISGEINSNEDLTYYIDVDSTVEEAQFILGHFIANISLILTMPNGSIVNTETIKNNPENAFINRTFLTGYHLSEPAPGRWGINISCKDAYEGRINFSLYTFFKTNITLEISLSKHHYRINEQINLTAELKESSNPITGAKMTAKIKRSDDSTETLALYDDGTHNDLIAGDGIYNNIYTGTDFYGRYDITLTANGTRNNEKFSRGEFVSVWVEDYPDLIIKNISFSNTEILAGDDIKISALIENIGEKEALNATIEFYHSTEYEDEFIGETNVSIGIGDEVIASVNWTNPAEGSYNITVLISPFNSFLERNYSNNRLKEGLHIFHKLIINITSPVNNGIYNITSIGLNLTTNKKVDWCAYSLDGEENKTLTNNVECWGITGGGQLNHYTGGDAVQVSTDIGTTCILKSNGNAECWGLSYDDSSNPYTNGDAVQISTDMGTTTCILKSNGNVECLRYTYGQSNPYTNGDAVQLSTGKCIHAS